MIRRSDGAYDWWFELTPDPNRHHAGNRGALARLRRCSSVAEAMQEPATMSLFQRCEATHPGDLPAIGLAAAVLAHVRRDQPGMPVARLIGPDSPDKPETALMKPLRFRRLLEAGEPDECLIVFRRLVALAGGEVQVRDLSRALLDWTNPYRQDETKRRWIYTYWNANPMKAEEIAA